VGESTDKVVVISGASRGIGRGIARVFAGLGATVYVVGRTGARGARRRAGEAALPGTVDSVANEINTAGGRGLPVVCDMADDSQIATLFERIRRESGHVDVLVNNAALIHDDMVKRARFWEKSLDLADIIDVGLRCHYVATYHAVPLMIARANGLIVNVSFYGGARMHDPAYYACKAGLDAFAATAAADLATAGLAIVSLWPGIVSTERLQRLAEVMPELKAQLSTFESPEFVGRVIAALHADPALSSLSGKTLIAAELAHQYQIEDTGGRAPVSYRGIFGAPHPANDVDLATTV
jgi:NAD(P)-dependent dehydrogenase (short-subunit alcohol dehydrogenase family)